MGVFRSSLSIFSFLFFHTVFEQESLGYLYDTPDWIT
jgi:hypothetical protein